MDTSSVIAALEAALADQVSLAGGDDAVARAAEALATALRPALAQASLSLAEQAATEMAAQLPDNDVDVVVRNGEPLLVVRTKESDVRYTLDDLEARLTLRLPAILKTEIEEAAGVTGDSVNTYVVKTLSGLRRGSRKGKRITGTFQT